MSADDDVVWRGRIDRCPDGTLVGTIRDSFGFEIVLTGHRDVDEGGFVLEGRAGEPPGGYRVAAIDDGE